MAVIAQVDAFAHQPFTGNPAAVCLLDHAADDSWMQRFAAEMNLSETAFVVPRPGGFDLRWFTPAVEVALCGHATLASAYVIFRFLEPERDRLSFDSRSGELVVTRDGEWLTLDFPVLPARREPPPFDVAAGCGRSRRRSLSRAICWSSSTPRRRYWRSLRTCPPCAPRSAG